LLAVNGGYIALTKIWAQHLLERMGYMKRKVTSTAKVTVDDLASKPVFVGYQGNC